VDFYLPDLVTGYRKQYGQPPIVEFRAKDANGMLHDRKEADIVQIVDKTIIPRLEQLKVAEPYNSERLRTHFRNNTLVPFTYREDLDFSTFSKFAEKDLGLPGVQVNVRLKQIRPERAGCPSPRVCWDCSRYQHALRHQRLQFLRSGRSGKTNVEFYLMTHSRKTRETDTEKERQKPARRGKEIIQPTPGERLPDDRRPYPVHHRTSAVPSAGGYGGR
jgi:hypothetical protein